MSSVHSPLAALPKLKSIVLGKFDADSLGSHIANTLEAAGHQTERVQVGGAFHHFKWSWLRKFESLKNHITMLAQSGVKVTRSIRSAAKRPELNGADLAIVTNDVLLPKEVELLTNRLRCPIAIWFPDAVVNMGRTMFLNAPYHTVFIKDRFIVDRLKLDFPSRRFEYLPECCNPLVHRPVPHSPDDIARFGCDITTAGNCYSNRVAFFEQLREDQLNIKIWGNLPSVWMNVESIRPMLKCEYVVGDEKSKAFGCAKVVLNNLHPGEIDSLNCRAFEIPACKALQFVNYRDCLPELFEPDKEIVAFKSFGELKEKLRHYLDSPERRREIAEAGYKRVISEHTYEHRLATLVRTILG